MDIIVRSGITAENKLLAESVYSRLKSFDRYCITTEYIGTETLCIGGIAFVDNEIVIQQDVFKCCPYSLLYNDNGRFAAKGVDWNEETQTLTVQRSDGDITIKCSSAADPKYASVQIESSSILELCNAEFLEGEVMSDNIKFYPLNLFRIKPTVKSKELIQYLGGMLEAWKYLYKTLTVAFVPMDKHNKPAIKGEDTASAQFVLWDIVGNKPVFNPFADN